MPCRAGDQTRGEQQRDADEDDAGMAEAIGQPPHDRRESVHPGDVHADDYADDAQWYVGECHQQEGKFNEAIDAYNRVISNYPKGDRVPDAYYKRGLAFSQLGQMDRAVESLETLMKLFPEHDMARMAKQNLDRLKRGKKNNE